MKFAREMKLRAEDGTIKHVARVQRKSVNAVTGREFDYRSRGTKVRMKGSKVKCAYINHR